MVKVVFYRDTWSGYILTGRSDEFHGHAEESYYLLLAFDEAQVCPLTVTPLGQGKVSL